MRRLLVLLAILGSAGAVLLPMAAAQATTTQTIHLTGVPVDVGPAGCVPGDLMISGNGVLHMTVNNAGDFWETGTVEGAATATGFTGHAVAWFGSRTTRRTSSITSSPTRSGRWPMALRSRFTRKASSPSTPTGYRR